jgi:predicted DNA-binding transcriptional regulator YafY
MENQRLPRLLELVMILQSGVGTQLLDIMEELGISRSTAFRDLKILRDAGIPYSFEKGKGYQISATFYLPPLNMQTSEALALVKLIKRASMHVEGQVVADAVRALRKVTSNLSLPVREVCRGLLDEVTVMTPVSEQADTQTDLVSQLLSAIEENRCVEAQYQSIRDGNQRIIRLHPYHLICVDYQWLLIAVIQPGNGMRTIPLESLSQMRSTQSHFRRGEFDLKGYLGKAWRCRPEGQIYRVSVCVKSEYAASLGAIQWHNTQDYKILCDGRCQMSFEVDGLNEIANWVWQHHEKMTVCDPPELVAILKQRCEKMLEHLGGCDCSNDMRH